MEVVPGIMHDELACEALREGVLVVERDRNVDHRSDTLPLLH